MTTFGTVEEYLAAQPEDTHDVLVNIRALVHEVLPDATPDDPDLAEDLAPYVAGKGTLRFDLGTEIPYPLIRRAVAALVDR